MKWLIRYKKDDIECMSNLYPKHTHLPVILWVDSLGVARKNKHHQPRLKVQNVKVDKAVDDSFSMTISKDPQIIAGKCKLSNKDFKEVRQFIIDHYEEFMMHWNQEIDEYELKDLLTK